MKKIILGIFIFICGFIVGLNSVNSGKIILLSLRKLLMR